MKRTLLVFLVACTLSAAMVSRFRRARNSDEDEYIRGSSNSNISICEPQTPCGWAIYNNLSKIITMNITNTYCICAVGSACSKHEEDQAAKAYILKCQDMESEIQS